MRLAQAVWSQGHVVTKQLVTGRGEDEISDPQEVEEEAFNLQFNREVITGLQIQILRIDIME